MKLFLHNYHRKILNSVQNCKKSYSNIAFKPPWDVLFFGTDNFSLESLKTLHTESQKSAKIVRTLEVVTTTKNNYVKKYAEHHKIPIQSWPLRNVQICERFHVGIVVSFGNLIPKAIIEAFPLGMINVHASLLPRWRGAAPIIHSLAAGDEKTGVTIMKIRPHKFDIGEIIHQESVVISNQIRMPQLHDVLAQVGAKNLLGVLQHAPAILQGAKVQNSEDATLAPRINASMANVNFKEHSAKEIYNLSRALTGLYPLLVQFNDKIVKLHNIVTYGEEKNVIGAENQREIGAVIYEKHSKSLRISTKDGWILVDKISVPGKKVMSALDFKNGYLKTSQGVKFVNVEINKSI